MYNVHSLACDFGGWQEESVGPSGSRPKNLFQENFYSPLDGILVQPIFTQAPALHVNLPLLIFTPGRTGAM